MKEIIRFELNKQPLELSVNPDDSLLWVIRSSLNLTGTKFGCGLGQCGTCTVLINNKAERSCMLTVDFVQGKKVTTIEGLATNGELHPVQKAFMQHDALQCGFCTPGMILNACSLLHENPEPSSQEIIDGMEENLCRCGTYGRIIEAVQTAAKEMEGGIKL
jgi:aerobic-type carbon monoxide dehydrogenase small subunit (CoxS/CutS family)